MKDAIYFAKVKPNAKIPSKRDEDSGYDMYACFDDDTDYITIPPFESRLIPTGIASAFDKKYGLRLEERGSTGSRNIKRNAGTVDSGYRGEIFVCLYNANSYPITIGKKEYLNTKYSTEVIEGYIKKGYIYPYEKAIAQAVLREIPDVDVTEITYEELKNITSERGIGKIGSSNK